MSRSRLSCLSRRGRFVVALAAACLLQQAALAQGIGLGSGGTGGLGTGGFGGGTGSGGTGGFGTGGRAAGGLGGGLGMDQGFGPSVNQAGGSSFRATTSAFGPLSYERLPFGTASNLRGPQAAGGYGFTAGRSTAGFGSTRLGTTGLGRTTGLGGLGGLGGFGLGGLGGFNRMNQMRPGMQNSQQQSAVRTTISASLMREELNLVAAAPAEAVMERLTSVPGGERFASARVYIVNRTAILDPAALPAKEVELARRLIMLEPGIDDVVVQQDEAEVIPGVPSATAR